MKHNEQTKNLEEIEGIVERITFHSEESGFCVMQARCKGKKTTTKDGLTTVLGTVITIQPGEYILGKGYWNHDKNHGLQFKCKELVTKQPATLEGIEKYLASGLIKGIGKVYAARMIKEFKEEVFDVIENHPERLSDVDGIGKKRKDIIKRSWDTQKIIREIMIFLQSNGVSTSLASKIYKSYGDKAIDLVKQNPYQLAKDIRGIGFISADRIASNLGIVGDSDRRIEAGIDYTLMIASEQEGHCGLEVSNLQERVISELGLERKSENKITAIITKKISDNSLKSEYIEQQPFVFLPPYYIYESWLAEKLIALSDEKASYNIENIDSAIDWVQKKLSINLADGQKKALIDVLNNKVSVITGGPGTGKTTLVKSIITILRAKKLRIKLASPTGKAAKRLSESTGMEAFTIHRLLEFQPGKGCFKFNEEENLDCDVLILDESSMVDVKLMYNLLKSLPDSASFIAIGDIDQLPSIGAGEVLRDMIISNRVCVAKLTEIFRQAETSDIIKNAYRVNSGLMPLYDNSDNTDFFFIESDKERIPELVVELLLKRIPKKFGYDFFKQIQILCPMNRGISGGRNLNVEIQKLLRSDSSEFVTKYGYHYYVGDKVMQIENNYDLEVYNGEIGFITAIDQENQEVTIQFDENLVKYEFIDLDQVVLSYATTIHKSQGSEYDCIILPISMQSYLMLERNLIYTGITRGKKLVVLVGEKKALAIAVKKSRKEVRHTRLKFLLDNTK